MYSSAILNVTAHRLAEKTIKEDFYESFSVITLPERKRFLKKLIKTPDKNYIIRNGDTDRAVFRRKMKSYSEFSTETVICVINKICREAAKEYSKKLPFEEITVIGSPDTGLKIFEKLKDEARLFTVITDCRDRVLADELYFKYGMAIRYKKALADIISPESLLISLDEAVTEKVKCCPVINLTKRVFPGKNIINISETVIKDKNTLAFSKLWNGCVGPEIYSLLNICPEDCASVEINKKTDGIFLLDTDAF